MTDPSKKLTEDHVDWVVRGTKRSQQIQACQLFFCKVVKVLWKVLKWTAESLKWSVPLFVAAWTVYSSGSWAALISTLKGLYT